MIANRAFQQLACRSSSAAAAAVARLALPTFVSSRSHSRSSRNFSTTTRVAEEATAGYTGNGGVGDPASPPPVFASYNVYKSRGALSVKPIKATWAETPGGGLRIDREGTFFFELAQAIGERKYNWEQKVAIAMKPEEVANIFASPDSDHTVYHDTFKGQPGKEGTLVKTLKWSRAPDGKAYFINASVSDKGAGTNTSASCSLTLGEFYLLKCLVDSSFVYLKGWDAILTQY